MIGIESPHDLKNPDYGDYGEMNKGWSAEEAKGFIKLIGQQSKIHRLVNA